MTLGYDKPLYILAFDHRGSFEEMVGISGRPPTAEETRRLAEAKAVIFDGFRRAVGDGVARDAAGVLVDLQYGEAVVRLARADGYTLSIPVEKSGQKEFAF